LVHRLVATTQQRNMIVSDYARPAGAGRPKINQLHGVHDRTEYVWLHLGVEDDVLRFNKQEFDNWARKMKVPVNAAYAAFRTHLNGASVSGTLGVGVKHDLVQHGVAKMQAPLYEITLPSALTQQVATGQDDATTDASHPHSSSPAEPPGSPSST
jgi:hypothetical protein